jgi:hypothetical protein
MKSIVLFFFSLLILNSCTDVIDIDLNELNPAIVIEGEVTNIRGSYQVKISRSINFSDPNNYPTVSGADVTISDNAGISEKLKEITPGIYKTSTIRGIPGRRYTLNVVIEGKTYTAVSTMPTVVLFENIEITESEEPNLENTKITNYDILPIFLDPEEAVNYYNFNIYVNGKKTKGFFNVKNDLFINGQYNVEPIFTDLVMNKNDSIKVEMMSIDKGVYNFYNSLAIANEESGTPVNPINNISGGAFGYFSAHTFQTKTVAVK